MKHKMPYRRILKKVSRSVAAVLSALVLVFVGLIPQTSVQVNAEGSGGPQIWNISLGTGWELGSGYSYMTKTRPTFIFKKNGVKTSDYDGEYEVLFSWNSDTDRITISDGEYTIASAPPGGIVQIYNVPEGVDEIACESKILDSSGHYESSGHMDPDPQSYHTPMSGLVSVTLNNTLRDGNGNVMSNAYTAFRLTGLNIPANEYRIFAGMCFFSDGNTIATLDPTGTTDRVFRKYGDDTAYCMYDIFGGKESRTVYLPSGVTLEPIVSCASNTLDGQPGSSEEYISEFINPKATKKLKDKNDNDKSSEIEKGDYKFSVQLKGKSSGDGAVEHMPSGSVDVKAGGEIDFGNWSFTCRSWGDKTITYTFDFREVEGTDQNIEYDPAVFRMKVEVEHRQKEELKTSRIKSIGYFKVLNPDTENEAEQACSGIEFTNRKTAVDPPSGTSLKIGKITTDEPDPGQTSFSFRIKLTSNGGSGQVLDPGQFCNGVSFTAEGGGLYSFNLSGGQTITLNGLPENTTYRVYEWNEADEYAVGKGETALETSSSIWRLKSIKDENGTNLSDIVNGTTATGAAKEIYFTNEYYPTMGELEVKKTAEGGNDEFDFRIKLSKTESSQNPSITLRKYIIPNDSYYGANFDRMERCASSKDQPCKFYLFEGDENGHVGDPIEETILFRDGWYADFTNHCWAYTFDNLDPDKTYYVAERKSSLIMGYGSSTYWEQGEYMLANDTYVDETFDYNDQSLEDEYGDGYGELAAIKVSQITSESDVSFYNTAFKTEGYSWDYYEFVRRDDRRGSGNGGGSSTVTHPDPNQYYGNGSFFTEVPNEEGVYSFKLNGGQSIKLENIPPGVLYEVYEVDGSGNVVSKDGTPKSGWMLTKIENENGEITGPKVEGTLSADAKKKALFTNSKSGSDVTLTVTKTVTGNMSDMSRDFSFEVKINGGSGSTGGRTETFTLGHGGSKEISGIAIGSSVEVSENNYSGDGYRTMVTVGNGLAQEKRSASIDSIGSNTTVAFTNSLNGSVPTNAGTLWRFAGLALILLTATALAIRWRRKAAAGGST